MNALLHMKLHKASLTPSLKGRVTKPAAGLDDKGFTYVPSLNTDLEATFARIFGQMGERKKEKV
jgi:hypothetical protein